MRDVHVRIRRLVVYATDPRAKREAFEADVIGAIQARLGADLPALTHSASGPTVPMAELIGDAVSAAVRRAMPGVMRGR